MGGTFESKIGGHNLFEPAILGKKIIGGANYNNFPDIGEELIKSGVYSITNDSDEMMNIINSALMKDEEIEKKAVQIVNNKRGSIAYILKEIKSIG